MLRRYQHATDSLRQDAADAIDRSFPVDLPFKDVAPRRGSGGHVGWGVLYLAGDASGAGSRCWDASAPTTTSRAALKDVTDEDGDPAPIPAGRVPLSWLSRRRVAHARIMAASPTSAILTPYAGWPARLPEASSGVACVTSTCRRR